MTQYTCPDCGEKMTFQLPHGFHAGTDTLNMECMFCGDVAQITVSIKSSSKKAHYTSEVWLREHYVDKDMTMAEIAKVCAVSPMTVNRWLKIHGIETRRRGHR